MSRQAFIVGLGYPAVNYVNPVGESETYKAYGKLYTEGFYHAYDVGEHVVVTREPLPQEVVDKFVGHDYVDEELEAVLLEAGYLAKPAPVIADE